MLRHCLSPLTLLLITALAAPSAAFAAWPHSSLANLPVSAANGEQNAPAIVADGVGGAFVTWHDLRSGNYDIYAQHILASGVADPAWPAGGRAVCADLSHQLDAAIVTDGSGGVIVTWRDFRPASNYDIYAQHVLASGAVDPAWPVNGRALCTAVGDQMHPLIVSDGAGGGVVTWYDNRSGNQDIYAQRVLASGAVDPAWPVDGRALCTAPNVQQNQTMVSDGAGGAIATWYDFRSGTNYDVYAQRVLVSGVVDPAWPVNGRAVVTNASDQHTASIDSDGAGGAIVTWMDFRSGATADIYAQHLLVSGTVDPVWPVDGRSVCAAANNQQNPIVAADGSGGAIITWQDNRSANLDIYAQHLLAVGIADPAWPVDGRALCVATGTQQLPQIVTDGAAGAIVTWGDFRSGGDIYAQRILASGVVDPAWPADGRALCTVTNVQDIPRIVADGMGGAIVTWPDLRAGGSNYDVYAQRVARSGDLGTPEPVITGVTDVPNDQGGQLRLAWTASWLDFDIVPATVNQYRIYRSVPPNGVAAATTRMVEPREQNLLAELAAVTGYAWEYIATVNAQNASFLTSYGLVVKTLGDSTANGNPTTAFLVAAFNAAGDRYWYSLPASGYSVDDLAPAAPAPFTGQYVGGATQLHWNRNSEPDLAYYRLYRGNSAGFVPGPGNLIASPPDTGAVDAGAAGSYYKLSAVDTHGNESAFALLSPSATTGVEGAAVPAIVFLAAPTPNPACGGALMRFGLPRATTVTLAIYDMGGRRVRDLAHSSFAAGEHALRWDGRNASGREVASGLYLLRLEAESRTFTQKLIVAGH